jgi:GT2 family glycosyltransferase
MGMDLSIIIVSYNVRYFLEQLLYSIEKAVQDIQCEIIVVDNNSIDDTLTMIKNGFPKVTLIENKDNPGFSVANNQGLKLATGKYILFLNPDTLVSEDTFAKCIDYIENHPHAGALGVRMVDGGGSYLPESKRGLPTPETAIYKIIGLHRLFPKSKKFNRYYMGHIDEYQTDEIEVLTGAFFFVKKELLDQIGGFDETFFMYGEDIDLSYRVLQTGQKIIYFPETSIIHYKGESTQKGSIKYIKHFHEAMLIFAEKHFKNGYPLILRLLLKVGVYVKALQSVLKSFFTSIFWPLMDIILMFLALTLVKYCWAVGYHQDPMYYSGIFEKVNLPIFISLWLTTFYLKGVYDDIKSMPTLISGIIIGLLINGLIYGMLNPEYRPSRPILLFGFLAVLLILPAARILYFLIKEKRWLIGSRMQKRIAIVADSKEYIRLSQLIKIAEPEAIITGRIYPENLDDEYHHSVLGRIDDLDKINKQYHLDEVVIASKNFSASEVMKCLSTFGDTLYFKIASAASDSIIGSKSKNVLGEFYSQRISYNLSMPKWRRGKILLDIVFSLLFLCLYVVIVWFYKSKIQLLKNIFTNLIGQTTWVGYTSAVSSELLPDIPPAIIPNSQSDQVAFNAESILNKDISYAQNYRIGVDIERLLQNLHLLSRQPV